MKRTVSLSLSALESRGQLTKQVDQKDRRSKYLSLTAKGKNLLLKDPSDKTVKAIDQLASTS